MLKWKRRKISIDKWKQNQLFENDNDRTIHIKEIDDKLDMKYEYYSKIRKNGNEVYYKKILQYGY